MKTFVKKHKFAIIMNAFIKQNKIKSSKQNKTQNNDNVQRKALQIVRSYNLISKHKQS